MRSTRDLLLGCTLSTGTPTDPSFSDLGFCWPSSKGWDCDRKGFIEEYKSHENPVDQVSLHWGTRPAIFAAFLDSPIVDSVKMAKELSGIMYEEDDERKVLQCLVDSMFYRDLN